MAKVHREVGKATLSLTRLVYIYPQFFLSSLNNARTEHLTIPFSLSLAFKGEPNLGPQ